MPYHTTIYKKLVSEEINLSYPPFGGIRIVLVYPNYYHIGMSNILNLSY